MANSIKISEDLIQTVAIPKETSLGLSLVGGISRTEGPFIHIKDIIPGGDCQKDGRLRPGDQLVSVNKESLIGVSCEEAKSILNRAKLRKWSSWEISFIRHGETHLDSLLPTENAQKRMDFASKMSSTPDSTKTNMPSQSGYCKEQRLSTTPDRDIADMSVPNQGRSRERLISLNPDVQLKVEKLEMALNYLGINPTEEQKQLMKSHVKMDANGNVLFGDFVRVAKKIFNLPLQDRDLGQDLMMLKEHQVRHLLDSVTTQVQSCDISSDVDRLKKERDDAFAQLKMMKEQFLESEKQKSQLSVELTNVKQEAKAAIEETRALRSRIHLAEVAQRQASGMEMDYEEVIHLLESEIMELKAQLVDHSGQNKDSEQDLRRRVTVLDCQLRKSEMARKTFEVSTEKLLQFVENIHEVLSDESSTLNLCERAPTFSSQITRLGKSRLGVMAALAAEAKDLSRSVRSLIEVDCLPYGWEETYTADGIKYFIKAVQRLTRLIYNYVDILKLKPTRKILLQ
ncbi:syntaxin-binding protein 4 isoform X2 [Pseudophryne corroboree]|uniref:syntaxin-binding protein 4 isoform X2 n=1 Tax=Pseudophryne corroboree TaxID=495146 RepID=UPI00308204F8